MPSKRPDHAAKSAKEVLYRDETHEITRGMVYRNLPLVSLPVQLNAAPELVEKHGRPFEDSTDIRQALAMGVITEEEIAKVLAAGGERNTLERQDEVAKVKAIEAALRKRLDSYKKLLDFGEMYPNELEAIDALVALEEARAKENNAYLRLLTMNTAEARREADTTSRRIVNISRQISLLCQDLGIDPASRLAREQHTTAADVFTKTMSAFEEFAQEHVNEFKHCGQGMGIAFFGHYHPDNKVILHCSVCDTLVVFPVKAIGEDFDADTMLMAEAVVPAEAASVYPEEVGSADYREA